MSEERQAKPAPTAAEISKARDFLDDRYLDNVLSLEFPRTVDHIRTLLAALDAAEATKRALRSDVWRVMPTEDGDGGEKWRAFAADRDMAASSAEAQATAAEERAESVHAAWSKCLKLLATAERERDELRDALKLYEAFPELATGDTARRDEQRAAYNGLRWVLGLLAGLDDGRQDSVAKAFRPVVEKIKRERDEARAALKPGAIVVSDTEETRERIARALWDGEGYSEPWGESARNSHPVTYRCVLRDTDAVLAALRESAR